MRCATSWARSAPAAPLRRTFPAREPRRTTSSHTRATGIALESDHIDVERANGLLRLFLKNRWIGLWPILYGDQVRQTALDNWIFQGTLDVEHLPQPQSEVAL